MQSLAGRLGSMSFSFRQHTYFEAERRGGFALLEAWSRRPAASCVLP